MTKPKLSNAIARKYFLHDLDDDQDGEATCYFCSHAEQHNGKNEVTQDWGFWVDASGKVDYDELLENDPRPSRSIVDHCVRAAVKHLRGRNR